MRRSPEGAIAIACFTTGKAIIRMLIKMANIFNVIIAPLFFPFLVLYSPLLNFPRSHLANTSRFIHSIDHIDENVFTLRHNHRARQINKTTISINDKFHPSA